MTTQTVTSNNSTSQVLENTPLVKPVRREFYNTLVIKNNGAIVAEPVWKAIAQGSTPREVRKQLKNAGMQTIRVFDKEAYDGSRSTFKDGIKLTAKAEREAVITDAFKEADVASNPRIISALKTLLPLFREIPTKKTVSAFRNIIRSCAATQPDITAAH